MNRRAGPESGSFRAMTGQRAPWRFFCIFPFFESVGPGCGGYREAVSSGICAKTPARHEYGMLNKDNVMKGFKCLLVSFFCLVAVSGAQGEMITVVDATGSSSFNQDADFAPWYLVNDSGLDEKDPNAVTHDLATLSNKNSWLSASTDTEWLLIFDLGAIYDLASLQIWNFNYKDQTGSGAKDVNISTSIVDDDSAWTDPIPFDFLRASGELGYAGFTLNVSSLSPARYVQFAIESNYDSKFGGPSGYNLVGLSEVRFYGTPVPEPSSLLLLGAGLAGIGLVSRRRRS